MWSRPETLSGQNKSLGSCSKSLGPEDGVGFRGGVSPTRTYINVLNGSWRDSLVALGLVLTTVYKSRELQNTQYTFLASLDTRHVHGTCAYRQASHAHKIKTNNIFRDYAKCANKNNYML